VRWYDFGLRVFPPTFRAPGWFYPAVYAVIILVCGVLAARRLGLSAIARRETAPVITS
jgi:hypothetical protein